VAQPPGGASSICLGMDSPPRPARKPSAQTTQAGYPSAAAQARLRVSGSDSCQEPIVRELAAARPHTSGGFVEPRGYAFQDEAPEASYGRGLENDWRGAPPQIYEDRNEVPRAYGTSAAGQTLNRSRLAGENDASFSNRRPSDGAAFESKCPAKLNQRHAELCAAGRRRRVFPNQGISQIVFG
jgi:hypothetical protein